jgi:hypothetical protein
MVAVVDIAVFADHDILVDDDSAITPEIEMGPILQVKEIPMLWRIHCLKYRQVTMLFSLHRDRTMTAAI